MSDARSDVLSTLVIVWLLLTTLLMRCLLVLAVALVTKPVSHYYLSVMKHLLCGRPIGHIRNLVRASVCPFVQYSYVPRYGSNCFDCFFPFVICNRGLCGDLIYCC